MLRDKRARVRALGHGGALLALGAGLVFSPQGAAAQDDTEEDQEAVPEPPPGGSPHGGAGSQTYQPPPDTNDPDPRLPAGTIAVTLLNPDNAAIPGMSVTLGILHNTVAKGESREHKVENSGGNGEVDFHDLTTGSGIAYRVSVVTEGATFWASPFALPQDKGMRVVLHVFPVTHDIKKALVVSQAVLYAEMKDDRVQFEEAISFFNLGKVAWVPDNLVLALPETFTALTSQQAMGGEGVDPIDKQGAKIRGTFGPGQHTVDFRWQVPYEGTSDVDVEIGLPPNVAIARAMAPASQQMHLVVAGFPDAQARSDAQGERILITERQMRRDEPPLTHLRMSLRDLPTPGPGRVLATLLAGLAVVFGVGYAFASKQGGAPAAATDTRARLLGDLEELERARRAGDIGPKTYERARRELIDAIARSLAPAPNSRVDYMR
jgi:hypothetical protein